MRTCPSGLDGRRRGLLLQERRRRLHQQTGRRRAAGGNRRRRWLWWWALRGGRAATQQLRRRWLHQQRRGCRGAAAAHGAGDGTCSELCRRRLHRERRRSASLHGQRRRRLRRQRLCSHRRWRLRDQRLRNQRWRLRGQRRDATAQDRRRGRLHRESLGWRVAHTCHAHHRYGRRLRFQHRLRRRRRRRHAGWRRLDLRLRGGSPGIQAACPGIRARRLPRCPRRLIHGRWHLRRDIRTDGSAACSAVAHAQVQWRLSRRRFRRRGLWWRGWRWREAGRQAVWPGGTRRRRCGLLLEHR
mmetsp:Transcript_105351/g.307982  ORF Transcript_105351/g.307982 Transcript_105351/m.307982 type:complete len:299 (-) Transcript_105351:299-1195(-)